MLSLIPLISLHPFIPCAHVSVISSVSLLSVHGDFCASHVVSYLVQFA
jgi:hypothetical protein